MNFSDSIMANSVLGGADDEEIGGQRFTKWPLEYVKETKEYTCGWCGQALLIDRNENLEMHFESCKRLKENVFQELRKFYRKFDDINAELDKKMVILKTQVKEEIKAEIAEVRKENLDFKLELKKDLETERKAQELKMAKVSGITETVSTLVRSLIGQVRGTSSTDTAGPDQSNAGTESISEPLKTSAALDLRVKRKQVENELKEVEAANKSPKKKTKSFHADPITVPMNCFNLVTRKHLFQPSFKWTIDGIKNKMERETLELISEMFHWNGYPVQARAKLQLREDDCVYLSLRLEDEDKLEDFALIPHVFGLLKDQDATNSKHKCKSINYLLGAVFSQSCDYDQFLCGKCCLNNPTYNVNDAIEVEIYVEPLAVTQLVYSYDGTLEWNLGNYARRLELEKSGVVDYQESPYFYTGPRGYRMQVEICLNGDDGPVARISFLTGEFDDELPESFPHSTTVTLMNRKDPEKSLVRTVVGLDEEEYEFEICKVGEVESVVENDTLFCKVVVKAQ